MRVVSFDGASEDEARSASARQTDLMWLPVIGLDRHTPMIGLAPQSGSAAAPQNALPRVQAAVYRRSARSTRPLKALERLAHVLDLGRRGEAMADQLAPLLEIGQPRKSTVWFSTVSQPMNSR